MADIQQWWDYTYAFRRASTTGARAMVANITPHLAKVVHMIVLLSDPMIHEPEQQNNAFPNHEGNANDDMQLPNQQNHQEVVHQAALRMGELMTVATVAFLPVTLALGGGALLAEPPTLEQQQAFGHALLGENPRFLNLHHLLEANQESMMSDDHHLQSNVILFVQKHLWQCHRLGDTITPRSPLFCSEETLKAVESWHVHGVRWNGPRLRELYQTLRQTLPSAIAPQKHDSEQSCDNDEETNEERMVSSGSAKQELSERLLLQSWRRRLEQKMGSLLHEAHGQRVANYVLTTTISATSSGNDIEMVFGRTLAVAKACAAYRADYIVVGTSKAVLDPLCFATALSCPVVLDLLKTQSHLDAPKKGLSIPLGNPMITMRLVPALFCTGTEDRGVSVDFVLGSGRIWDEHMALKAAILYMFQGQSNWLWSMSRSVVQSALPKTWDYLFASEPPDEEFLRALLHPDVMGGGRLWLEQESQQAQMLPRPWMKMAHIYMLARFFSTLPIALLDTVLDDAQSAQPRLASAMKLSSEQVRAITVRISTSTKDGLGTEDCLSILRTPIAVQSTSLYSKSASYEGTEILEMLAVFLHRYRQSHHDVARGKTGETEPITVHTSWTLADCAMFCGSIRWLSEEEEWEEGLWTCTMCLHRWQRREKRDAFQSRKFMHPMKMIPFQKDEYYDFLEYENVMEATGHDISMLGKDYYWGECSSCHSVFPAVARGGACAETDGVPLEDFPEYVSCSDDSQVALKTILGALGKLGANQTVTSSTLEKYFDSEEKLAMIPGPLRRRVRNCVDKSRYILPQGILCTTCSAVPTDSVEDYCPKCGTGFEPVFACVHYSCPRCGVHFCKACMGIDGVHFTGVYSSQNHVCWRLLGNRNSYHNTGFCKICNKERPWPASHRLASAGPEITRRAMGYCNDGMSLEEAISMQADNLSRFTARYHEAEQIFLHEKPYQDKLGPDFCHCAADASPNDREDDYY